MFYLLEFYLLKLFLMFFFLLAFFTITVINWSPFLVICLATARFTICFSDVWGFDHLQNLHLRWSVGGTAQFSIKLGFLTAEKRHGGLWRTVCCCSRFVSALRTLGPLQWNGWMNLYDAGVGFSKIARPLRGFRILRESLYVLQCYLCNGSSTFIHVWCNLQSL